MRSEKWFVARRVLLIATASSLPRSAAHPPQLLKRGHRRSARPAASSHTLPPRTERLWPWTAAEAMRATGLVVAPVRDLVHRGAALAPGPRPRAGDGTRGLRLARVEAVSAWHTLGCPR